MSDTWKFHQQWRITGRLQTLSSLHVGSGETVSRPDLVSDDGPVEINGVVTDFDNRPCIPGSALKGNLLAWLRRHIHDNDGCCFLLYELFGREPLTVNGKIDQGCGGRAEFLDARLACPRSGPVTLAYWNSSRQTSVEVSVAIDHHTRTAEEKKLIHREIVPPGVTFSVTLQGALSEDEVGLLLVGMEGFNHDTDPMTLGAHTANGQGRLSWELAGVEQIGRDEVRTWLQAEKRTMASEIFTPVQAEQCSNLLAAGHGFLKNVATGQQLNLELAFDGPFVVNDPPTADELKRKKEKSADIPDHRPLRDISGRPCLPEKSVRGALRAQAARIIRTLGGTCCEENSWCTAGVHQLEDTKNLCPVCRLFGAPGWKSVIRISDFTWIGGGSTGIRQDFVAIDRFTGGAVNKAKFDADYVYAPVFQGILSLDTQRPDALPEWGKGLLALVLRDLKEGDITFGFGRAKGYGIIARAKVSGDDFLKEEKKYIKALHDEIQVEDYRTTPATDATAGEKEAEAPPRSPEEAQKEVFHNPYHFIPIQRPDTADWLSKEEFTARKTGHHTHARYFDSLNNKKIYNGRLLCRLETETPLFIGGVRSKGTEPLEIAPFLLNDKPAIPATSLRGMLSSLVEAASDSSLRMLEDSTLSFRKEARQALRGIGLIVIKNDRKRFILPFNTSNVTKLKNAYTKKTMIQFLKNKNSWSPRHNQVYYLPERYNHKTVPCKSYKEGLQPGILRILGKDEHRESMLENKKHELFLKIPVGYVDTTKNSFLYEKYIADNQEKLLTLSSEAWSRFHDLADERTLSQKNDKALKRDKGCTSTQWLPFHLKGMARKKQNKACSLLLQHADLIYYNNNQQKKRVAEISFSSIWRGRVEKKDGERAGVHDFFREIDPELLPFSPKRKKISPAEWLFGFVEDRTAPEDDGLKKQKKDPALAFAGKVRVSFGRPAAGQDNSVIGEPVTLKVLATPKPPSPALYFKGKTDFKGKNRYISKASLSIADGDQPQGRKIYLHAMRDDANKNIVQLDKNGYRARSDTEHPLFFPWESKSNHYPPDKEDDRANLKASITPLREKTVFYFHIDFDNLSREELELLCFALRPFASFRHKLGMGKPIGLGSVRIDPVGLFCIDRQGRYQEDGFSENRYNDAVWKKDEPDWSDEWQELYPMEAATKREENTLPAPEILASCAAAEIKSDVFQALRLIGDPQMVTAPVHYPQVHDHDIEDRNFQWFVANDKGTNNGRKGAANKEIGAKKDYLKPLDKSSSQLPGLTRHEWLGK